VHLIKLKNMYLLTNGDPKEQLMVNFSVHMT
jgi:hypothetical protein